MQDKKDYFIEDKEEKPCRRILMTSGKKWIGKQSELMYRNFSSVSLHKPLEKLKKL